MKAIEVQSILTDDSGNFIKSTSEPETIDNTKDDIHEYLDDALCFLVQDYSDYDEMVKIENLEGKRLCIISTKTNETLVYGVFGKTEFDA